MVQKLVTTDAAQFIKSRANATFIAVIFVILGILFGYVLGRNSVQTTNITSVETPTEDEITTRKSIEGKVTSIDGNSFKIQNETAEYTILTNSDTIVMRGTIEMDKEVVLTVLQTGNTYLAEKVRVL
jgi:hypothetical protein